MGKKNVKVGDMIRVTHRGSSSFGEVFEVLLVYNEKGKVQTQKGLLFGSEYEIVSQSIDVEYECVAVGGVSLDKNYKLEGMEQFRNIYPEVVKETPKPPVDVDQHLKKQLDDNLRRAFG